MNIGLISDLHFNYSKPSVPNVQGIDVLLVAGDMDGDPDEVATWLADLRVPVIAVLGNHDHWSDIPMDRNIITWKEAFEKRNLTLLECETIDFRGVRFAGATLWTDYGENRDLANRANEGMNDFKKIKRREIALDSYKKAESIIGGFPSKDPSVPTPVDFLAEFMVAKDFFKKAKAAAKREGIPIVCISHHSPSLKSLIEMGMDNKELSLDDDSRYKKKKSIRRAAYASQSKLLDGAAVWVHGHTHGSFQCVERGGFLACNARGYSDEEVGGPNPMIIEMNQNGFIKKSVSIVKESIEEKLKLLKECTKEMEQILNLFPHGQWIKKMKPVLRDCLLECWSSRMNEWIELMSKIRDEWSHVLPKNIWVNCLSHIRVGDFAFCSPNHIKALDTNARWEMMNVLVFSKRMEWLLENIGEIFLFTNRSISSIDGLKKNLQDLLLLKPYVRNSDHTWRIPFESMGCLEKEVRKQAFLHPWEMNQERTNVAFNCFFEIWLNSASGYFPKTKGAHYHGSWTSAHESYLD